jgi:biotin operon repressor
MMKAELESRTEQKDRWLYDDWLHELYWNRYLTLQEVADKVGCSDKTIEKYLKKRGEGTRPRGSGAGENGLHDYDMLRWLYVDLELTGHRIAEDLGTSRRSVDDALERAGIEKRERGGGSHNRLPRPGLKLAHPTKEYGVRYYSHQYNKKRKRVVERDSGVCQDCGSEPVTVHVHHIVEVLEFDNPDDAHTMENMVCLCSECHWDRHGYNWGEE